MTREYRKFSLSLRNSLNVSACMLLAIALMSSSHEHKSPTQSVTSAWGTDESDKSEAVGALDIAKEVLKALTEADEETRVEMARVWKRGYFEVFDGAKNLEELAERLSEKARKKQVGGAKEYRRFIALFEALLQEVRVFYQASEQALEAVGVEGTVSGEYRQKVRTCSQSMEKLAGVFGQAARVTQRTRGGEVYGLIGKICKVLAAKVVKTAAKIEAAEAEASVEKVRARAEEAEVKAKEGAEAKAQAKVVAAEAKVAEARAKVTEREVKVAEARAKVAEAEAKARAKAKAKAKAKLAAVEAKVSEAEVGVTKARVRVKIAKAEAEAAVRAVKEGK